MAKTAPASGKAASNKAASGKAAPENAAPEKAAPGRSDVIAALADDILQHYSEGRVIVAIDGMDGAGKTEFADALAAHLRIGNRSVFRATIDDFHRPRVERYARGRDSAEGFYRDSFNYRTFRRVLTDPFRIGHYGSFVLQAFDLSRDAEFEPKWSSGPDDAILIVDGIFLNRPELKGIWNYSVWLEVDRKVAEARMRARDGESANPERYAEGQKLYLEEAKPQAAASAIIDNNDFDHPRRIFADSC